MSSTGFQFGAPKAADKESKSFSFTTNTAPSNAFSFGSAKPSNSLFSAPSTATSAAETSKPFTFGANSASGAAATFASFSEKSDATSSTVPATTAASNSSFSMQPSNANSAGQSFSFLSKPTAGEAKAPSTSAFSFKVPESSSESKEESQKPPAFSTNSGAKPDEAKKDESKPAFSTNSSFSFGATSLTPADTTKSTAQGSLFASPAASCTSSALTFPSTTQSDTKSSTGFSFGSTTSTSSNTLGSQEKNKDSVVPESTSTAAVKPPPAEYMGKTVEEIINMWSEQLERNADTFTKEAVKVSTWDMNLMEAQKNLGDIANDVRRIQVGQKELDSNLDTISAYQMELNSTLSQLEKSVDKMYEAQDQMPIAADMEREKTLQLSVGIDEELNEMTDTLKETIQELNQTQNQTLDENNPVTQIMKILNVHHNSLRWIEDNAKSMNTEIEQLSKKLLSASLH